MLGTAAFFEIVGGDSPHFGGQRNPDQTMRFFLRVIKAFNAPSPQRDLFYATIWREFCLRHAFQDPATRQVLVTVPAISQPVSQQLNDLLTSKVYSPVKFDQTAQAKNKGQYFIHRVKDLEAALDRAEPFATQYKQARGAVRAFRGENRELLFGTPNPDDADAAAALESAKAEEAKLQAVITQIDGEVAANSAEYAHLHAFKAVMGDVQRRFGLEQTEKDITKANRACGAAGVARGQHMEDRAFDAALKGGHLHTILVEAEKRRAAPKYSMSALSKLNLAEWLHRCNLLGKEEGAPDVSPPPVTPADFDAFQTYCRQQQLPHLALLHGVKYQSTIQMAGEFDGVLVDLLDQEVLLLMEVKAAPADSVYARCQRVRLERCVRQCLAAVGTAPPAAGAPPVQGAVPALTEMTVKAALPPHLLSIQSHIDQGGKHPVDRFLNRPSVFTTFLSNPVGRWVYLMPQKPHAETPPLYSPIIHHALREVASGWTAIVDRLVTERFHQNAEEISKFDLLLAQGNPEARKWIESQSAERAAELVKYVDFGPAIGALTYAWRNQVDKSVPGGNGNGPSRHQQRNNNGGGGQATLLTPAAFYRELEVNKAVRNAVFLSF